MLTMTLRRKNGEVVVQGRNQTMRELLEKSSDPKPDDPTLRAERSEAKAA